MAFPSELPAMRRQTLPPPHPTATALAWAGMSYAIATALLMALLPHTISAHLSASGALGIVIAASIVPAAIIGLMARRAPSVWSPPRVALPYLAMLAIVGGLLLVDFRTEWFLESLTLATR